MARRRTSSDQRMIFPWESRGAGRRWLGLGRMRPLLVVVVVVGLVAVVGVRERQRAGVRQTRAMLLDLRRAVDGYMAAHDGACPPSLSAALGEGASQRPLVDAWGTPFRFVCPGADEERPYELVSDGPDREPAGLDRID